MKKQEVRSAGSVGLLAARIVKIFTDRNSFSNEKEERVERTLARAYRKVAKEYGFGTLHVEARGMREGLGVFCHANPDSYMVTGESDPMLEIWVNRYWSDKRRLLVNHVIVRIADEHLEIGRSLNVLIQMMDKSIETSITGARAHKRGLRQFGEQLMSDVRDSDPH